MIREGKYNNLLRNSSQQRHPAPNRNQQDNQTNHVRTQKLRSQAKSLGTPVTFTGCCIANTATGCRIANTPKRSTQMTQRISVHLGDSVRADGLVTLHDLHSYCSGRHISAWHHLTFAWLWAMAYAPVGTLSQQPDTTNTIIDDLLTWKTK